MIASTPLPSDHELISPQTFRACGPGSIGPVIKPWASPLQTQLASGCYMCTRWLGQVAVCPTRRHTTHCHQGFTATTRRVLANCARMPGVNDSESLRGGRGGKDFPREIVRIRGTVPVSLALFSLPHLPNDFPPSAVFPAPSTSVSLNLIFLVSHFPRVLRSRGGGRGQIVNDNTVCGCFARGSRPVQVSPYLASLLHCYM